MHGLSVTLVDYALVFAKNMEKFVCNFRWMILLLIQGIIVVRVTDHKASGKCQIPVEVVSPTVALWVLFYLTSKAFKAKVFSVFLFPDLPTPFCSIFLTKNKFSNKSYFTPTIVPIEESAQNHLKENPEQTKQVVECHQMVLPEWLLQHSRL